MSKGGKLRQNFYIAVWRQVFVCLFPFRAAPAAYGSSLLGVELELQLPTYTTATAMQDLSRVYDLHQCSGQLRILNPLREARDRILILMDTSRVPNSPHSFLKENICIPFYRGTTVYVISPTETGTWVRVLK